MSRRNRQPQRPTKAPVTVQQPSSATSARWLVPLVLTALVLMVFAGVRNNGFLNYDDSIYVTSNATVQRGMTLDGIRWAFRSLDFNWHPVTWLTHMLDVELFGLDAGKHHLVNVAFHLANTLLLFFFLRKLTGAEARSAIVAALFAVHPLHVESVAWLAERKDVLSALFALLTLWMYADYARSRSKARYALALLFFILGLMSKGMLVTLPFVLLLLDWWPLQRLDRRAVIEKIPFFLLLVPAIAITLIAQKHVGALALTQPPGERVGNAVLSYGSYLWKTIWPANLAIPYPWRALEPLPIAAAAIVVLAISAAAFVYRRARPALFTGWFWFVGMLVPVIGFVQIGSQSMADRYTYLPHIGLFIAVVWLAADAVSGDARQMLAMVAAIVIAVFAFVAHRQVAYWHDSITLFTHSVQVTKRNAIAQVNLASALQDAGNLNAALEQAQLAADADPREAWVLVKLARIELQMGRTAEATKHLQAAAALDAAPETLALLALSRNDNDAAVAQYAKAVAKEPASATLHNDYGATLARARRNDEALAQYREAIRLSPGLYDTHMNLGALLARTGKTGEARDEFTAAATIRPGWPEPQVYLALLNANEGRVDLALMNAQTALAMDPVQANIQFTNAVHMPFKETNLQEFIAMLQSQRK